MVGAARLKIFQKMLKICTALKGLGEMNPDQLDFFLVDAKSRNVMQIEYPSDIEEFNRILGTSAGKGDLLRELGIVINGK